jgi:DNA-binding NarL/FixJ family response regulator
MTRILIVASDAALCGALRLMLRTRCAVEVVGEAANLADLRAQTTTLSPSAILLDWESAEMGGSIGLAGYRAAFPAVQIVALGVHAEEAPAILAAGADHFVHKGSDPERLIDVIQAQNNRQGFHYA